MTALMFAALALSAPVPKDSGADLKWKFAKGDTFYVKYDAESTVEIAGANGTNTRTVAVYKFTVLTAGEKECQLEVEYVSYKYGVAAGGRAVKADEVGGVAGLKATATVDPAGTVTALKGADEVAKAVANTLAAASLSEDYVRYSLTELFCTGPGKAARTGDAWKAEFDVPFAQGLRIKKEMRGKVDGVKDGLATLTVEEDYAVTPNADGGGRYELKGEKNPCTLQFDTKTGRLVKREEKHELTGTINLGGGGNPALTMKGKSTTTVTDKPPKDE